MTDPSWSMGRLIKLLLSSFPKARIKPALSRHDGELVHTPWKIRAAMEENKKVQINRRKVFE
jgi:hypothetical protein